MKILENLFNFLLKKKFNLRFLLARPSTPSPHANFIILCFFCCCCLLSNKIDFCLFCFHFQVQSVIQPNQQSVIQTATNVQPVQLSTKSNVILVSGKANSVIQTTPGSLQAIEVDYVRHSFLLFTLLIIIIIDVKRERERERETLTLWVFHNLKKILIFFLL